MKYTKNYNKNMNAPTVGIDIGESESVAHFVSVPQIQLSILALRWMMLDSMNSENAYRNARIAFEASGLAYPVFKKLKNLGYEDITVAHPKELAWIVKSKKKNDHVDSIKLAKLHLVDMLPKSNLLNPDEQIFRDLLVQRVKIGQQISNLKNSIIGYLKREDLFNKLPESNNNFSVKRKKSDKTWRPERLSNKDHDGSSRILGKTTKIDRKRDQEDSKG